MNRQRSVVQEEPVGSEDGQGGPLCAVCDVCFNGGACELSVEDRYEQETLETLTRESRQGLR